MVKYVIKRILLIIPIILIVAILIFTIMYFTPGDAARTILGNQATQEQVEALMESLGLNDSYFKQLLNFLDQLFLHFDFGTSYINGTSVMSTIISKLPNTLLLAAMALAVQICVGIPLGITAAFHQNKWQDILCTLVALLGASIPAFFVALVLILLLSNNLHLLPSYGIGSWQNWVMPFLAVGFSGLGPVARQTRSQMLEVIRSDYIVTARAKGLSQKTIKYKHALPNALIPVVTGMGNSFGNALGGTVVIETAFSIPGVGLYMYQAIGNRDLPVIRGGVIVISILFCLVMLCLDLAYAFIDPRIKAQYEKK
ncbi:MAG: ABC transporter permease [Oscillospiraceae bacterium]|nr:ABC transporter permease [Oscillospiraceae bacterium]